MKTEFIQLTENSGIVDLPVGAMDIELSDEKLYYFIPIEAPVEFSGDFTVSLPPGEWEMGSLAEKTAARIVKKQMGFGKYFDYVKNNLSVGKYGAYFIDTALESLNSLIESKGYFLKNPFGEEEPELLPNLSPPQLDEVLHKTIAWSKAEERAFKNPVLLIKK